MEALQRMRFFLAVWLAAVFVAGVVAVAADSDDDDSADLASVTTLSGDTSSSSLDAGSTVPGDTSSTDTTATTPGSTPATTAATTTGAPGATTTTKAGSTPRVQPDAGRYQLRVSGTSNFGGQTQPAGPSGELIIEQLNPTDQRITQPGGGGQFVLAVRWSPGAMSLVSLTVGVGSFAKTFAPASPVLFVPFPADVGKTWNWSLDSTDGKTHIDQTSRITRTESVTVAGTAVPTAVVESVLTLSGDITGTVVLTTWMSDADRLPVRTHSVTDAHAGLFAFSSDITTELVSLRPS